jgi:hypothetical protein
MKPNVSDVLLELSGLVARNAAPDIPPADRAGALGLTSALLAMASRTWDDAAHQLVIENRALRKLLHVESDESDFRISALMAENARLRARLIDCHIEAEASDPGLEAAIWAELVTSTERRLSPGSPV